MHISNETLLQMVEAAVKKIKETYNGLVPEEKLNELTTRLKPFLKNQSSERYYTVKIDRWPTKGKLKRLFEDTVGLSVKKHIILEIILNFEDEKVTCKEGDSRKIEDLFPKKEVLQEA